MDRASCFFTMKQRYNEPGPPNDSNHSHWYAGKKGNRPQERERLARKVPKNQSDCGMLNKRFLWLYQQGDKYSRKTLGVPMGVEQNAFLAALFVPTAWHSRDEPLPIGWAFPQDPPQEPDFRAIHDAFANDRPPRLPHRERQQGSSGNNSSVGNMCNLPNDGTDATMDIDPSCDDSETDITD